MSRFKLGQNIGRVKALFGKGEAGSLSKAGGEGADDDASETPEDAETAASERRMARVLDIARGKYKASGIVGSIDICTQIGPWTASLSCDVEGEEEEAEAVADGEGDAVASTDAGAEEEDKQELTRMQQLVVKYMDGCIHRLERR
jgi:hypothetical protein